MCNENKDTARKEESHAEVTDSQRRNAPLWTVRKKWPTDKDILATLITAENVKTTIFYHDQEALGKQIINLVKVITEDELIRRTGKKNIVFKKTQK